MLIAREMRGHPVQDDADPVLVQIVNEKHKILRGAVATGRRKVAAHLIAPGAIKGMLHERQEFDMSKAHLLHIRSELRRDFSIRKPAIPLFWYAPPGTEVHFVDRQ